MLKIAALILGICLTIAFFANKMEEKTQNFIQEKRIQKQISNTCEGEVVYIEAWDRYGDDIGAFICIPFKQVVTRNHNEK